MFAMLICLNSVQACVKRDVNRSVCRVLVNTDKLAFGQIVAVYS